MTCSFYTCMHICTYFPICICIYIKHIHINFLFHSVASSEQHLNVSRGFPVRFWSSFPVPTRNRKFLGVSVILGHPIDHGWREGNYEVRGPLAWRRTNFGISLYSNQDQTEAWTTLEIVPVIYFFHFLALFLSLQVSLGSTFFENHPHVSPCLIMFLGNFTSGNKQWCYYAKEIAQYFAFSYHGKGI